jgi:cell division protein FtsI (penicillin-binding protein 3)/stage V sporulation protein D (sporulation-specific penicillin-binding protein)
MDTRTRSTWILLFLACGFTVVSFNLIQIQLVQHAKYLRLAVENHTRVETILPIRGSIYDADHNVLAQSQRVYDVRLDGALEADRTHLGEIALALDQPLAKVLENFNPKNRDIPLATGLSVDDPAIARLRDLKLKSVMIKPRDERTYPNAELAAHVLGYIDDATGHGMAGMEKTLDKLLVGVPGKRYVERDARRQEIAAYGTAEEPAVDGDNVTLTIRLAIQHVVEEKLDGIVDQYHPDAAYIIVMDPHTGEILGMGSRPTYDPNDRKTFTPDAIRNRCMTDVAEPGSIFKIITLSGALNEGLVGLDTLIDCTGPWFYAGHTLKDDEPNGTLPVMEVMAKSSNIGFAKLGLNYLGPQRLYKYATAFGIGQRTNLFGNQSETRGILEPVSKWSALSVTRIPIGQEVAVSPIQMVTAMSVIANQGRMVAPHLAKEVADADGNVLQTYSIHTLRQVISPQAAQLATKALEQVTIDGTAKDIKVPGYTFAGKTGTAQKVVDGTYSHSQFVASFIGFLPAEDPAFVALVMVDDPKVKGQNYYGAKVSAPVFASLASQVAQILNLTPDQPLAPPAAAAGPTLTSSTDTKTKWTP